MIWAAAIFVAASVAMLVSLQIYSARDVDRRARERMEVVVGNGVANYVEEAARKAVPQAYWDDAVVHLDHRVDAEWATTFLGRYLEDTAGIDSVLVADRANRIVYGYVEGAPAPASAYADLGRRAARLVERVRKAEAVRGPLPPMPLAKNVRIDPVVAHDLVERNGRVLLMAATLVQPDDHARPLTDRAPVVITFEDLTTHLAQGVRKQFLLPDAALKIGRQPLSGTRASVEIRNSAGQTLAALEWRASRPGSALLRETGAATALFSLLLVLMVGAFVHWGRRLARALLASEAEAARLAFRDSLTGLSNRAHFARAFSEVASGSAGSFALHSIDLDHFKTVNDSFGHAAGDELIRVVAARLAECCSADDQLVRFGGDEFVILQCDADATAARALANRLGTALAQPVELGTARVFTSATVGIVIAGRDRSASEWLRRADLALYVAKARRRGSFAIYDPSMDEGVRERQDLNTRLHEALQAGRMTLAYQPQVDRQGQVIGLEALARWNDPEIGQVPPTTFVELAEETGLIDALGMFAIRQAFADSRRWPGVTIAVNVSAIQLRQMDFARRVIELAESEAIDPAQFEFEITERVLMGEDAQTVSSLETLRNAGFRIALDDFGTGYSNLTSLQRYPVDKIKIDRSFVARIGHEANAEALIVALVRLARAMDLDVIAEGVETEAQRLCLMVAGCPDVQGYLTGKPVPADEVEALIREAARARDGDPYGNRTRVSAVKGPRPNR